MTAPTLLPCTPYTTVETMRLCPPFDDPERYSDEVLEAAIAFASRIMYLATGRQFSNGCEQTVRPCGCQGCFPYGQDMGWGFILWPGMRRLGYGWDFGFNCGGRCYRQRCSCSTVHEVQLGVRPLAEVTEVRIDGAVLDPSAYRVDDWEWLVRLDGEAWPRCQDITAPDGGPDTWEVDMTWGLPPSAAVVTGTLALAGEVAKACGGDDTCGLPRRQIETIARQGVQITALDPMEFLSGTPPRTGVYEADCSIVMENPGGVSGQPVFVNPDTYREPVRRVNT